jgi:hypothetical protein
MAGGDVGTVTEWRSDTGRRPQIEPKWKWYGPISLVETGPGGLLGWEFLAQASEHGVDGIYLYPK